jgi:hypothetical protein
MTYDPETMYDSDREEDRRPVARQPRPVTCRNCPAGRTVINDGYGGWVHEDDYRYSCDMSNKGSTTVATPR